MRQEPFVKRAPEIAEGILAKLAAFPVLPKSISSFSKDLLSKQASIEEEKLALPKRMTLSELQKLAKANKVDFPKVADVSVDSASEIAASLRKIAEDHERRTAEDIFTSAAAIVAQGHRKEAITAQQLGGVSATLKKMTPEKGEGFAFLPWTVAGKKRRLQKRVLEEATPGSQLHERAREEAIEVARQRGIGEAAKERGKTFREFGKGLPALGIGTAAAVVAPAALTPGKREKIQVVK